MPTSPDDPGISPWKPRQPVESRRLNALQERVITEITVGPGLKMGRKGNQVSIGLMDQIRRPGGAVVGIALIVAPVAGDSGLYTADFYAGNTTDSTFVAGGGAVGGISG